MILYKYHATDILYSMQSVWRRIIIIIIRVGDDDLAKFQYRYTVSVVWILKVLNSSITAGMDHDDTTLNNTSSYKSWQMDR